MKFAISTAALFLLLGTTAFIYAQEKGHDEKPQESRPAQQSKPAQQPHTQQAKAPQQQSRPAQQPRTQQAKPVAQQQKPDVKPAQQPRTQQAKAPQQQSKPAQQPRTEQAARPQQQQANPVTRAPQGNAGQTQARTQRSQPVRGNEGGSDHGRISNAHYASSFGSGHSFHVNRGEYDHRRFQYGGYSFGFVDPWPIGWGYSDDVYVVYVDGGYYMYDSVHPDLRISVDIL